jgi:phenylacetate-coenzyme A ligase PaaK-like adenylate-forming protein
VALLDDVKGRRAAASEVATFGLELMAAYRRTTARRSAVRALQEKRLLEVLAAAQKTRLYGARKLRFLDDVKPVTKPRFLEDLDATVTDPALTRERLQRFVMGDASSAGEPMDGRYIAATTSGTTGQVGIFVDDLDGWARQRAIVFARMFQGLLTPEGFALLARRRYRLAFVVATGGHLLTSILASRLPKVGQLVAQTKVLSIESALPRIVDELNAYQPLLLHTYPTFLEVLAAERRKGTLRIEPEILSVGSEPVAQSCRDAVKAAFPSARLVETYAATECLAMATSCPHGTVHVNEDACILEPVDDDLRPVPMGQAAPRVLVTNLLNTVQPLLRYELTDSLALDDQPCPCGSPFLRVRVVGRTDDTFFLVDGQGRAQAHPPIPLEVTFLGLGGLLQYQIVHERQNFIRMLFVADAGADPAVVARGLEDRLGRYLDEHGLHHTVDFAIEQVDAIERHARSKKLRQITSRVGRPDKPVIASSEARRAPL